MKQGDPKSPTPPKVPPQLTIFLVAVLVRVCVAVLVTVCFGEGGDLYGSFRWRLV